ncbi:MAG: hypothetical protein PHQ74_14545 [Crocinitomicaceae bacterium]|nr:hypothetical protein [Crocinitomicaceae bacterium]
MKTIGNIFLTWRKGKGEPRFVIGIIRRSLSAGVSFSYDKKGLLDAKKMGFSMYEGFPDLDKTYSENVIEIFSQRLMRSERNDIKDFYDFWLIDDKYKKDDYYMLAHTQGILPTDNYEFLADFNPGKDLEFITEIAGLSKTNLPVDTLEVGDKLTYKKEMPENVHDKFAVKVFKDDLFLGHIKIIHNRVFTKTKTPLSITVHHIEKNGKLSRVFLGVKTKHT